LVAWRIGRGDFVFAIGDRALRDYSSAARRISLVPYGQDLGPCFAINRPSRESRLFTFLFSGQLLPRQNIRVIMEATSRLLDERGERFRLIIAAHGPEQTVIDLAMRRNPRLGRVLHYDRDYATWFDRLRPMAAADVLVYPSAHSGWGLVVPEAMAAGMAVIATSGVEAARYFIRDGENGLFIDPDPGSLFMAMRGLLDEPERAWEMGRAARRDAVRGHATVVAGQFADAVRGVLAAH
jgi:glycosyltransferase involved in cell wall biosynthesis